MLFTKSMEKSIQTAELTKEDIVKLEKEKMGYGCFVVLAVIFAAVIPLMYLYIGVSNLFIPAIIILLLLLAAFFYFIRNKDGLIDKDIWGGRKTVIIAPIESKRIKTSEVTRGTRQGSIDSTYFMTIDGKEYDMTERRYLTIKVGEFMELHEAPNSKLIIRQRWLKEDGNKKILEVDEDETV